MHELSVINGILSSVAEYAKKRRIKEIRKINVRAGRMSGIVPEAIRFAFKVTVKGPVFEKTKLGFKFAAPCIECHNCGKKTSSVIPAKAGIYCYDRFRVKHGMTEQGDMSCCRFCGSENVSFGNMHNIEVESIEY